MEYLLVTWEHNFIDEPIKFYMELDPNRDQLRVIEVFEDGKVAYASLEEEHETFLAIGKYPTVEEINSMDEFKATYITKKQFEDLWMKTRKRN